MYIKKLPYDEKSFLETAEDFRLNANDKKLKEFVQNKNVEYAIEVGTYLGRTLVYLATLLKTDGKILAVDTFEYNNDGYLYIDAHYHRFLSNIYQSSVIDKIEHLRGDSCEVTKLLDPQKKADLIYIDSDHDESRVFFDLNCWHVFLKQNGVLCGDDWCFWMSKTGDFGITQEAYDYTEKLTEPVFKNNELIDTEPKVLAKNPLYGRNIEIQYPDQFDVEDKIYTVRRAVKKFASKYNYKIKSYGNF